MLLIHKNYGGLSGGEKQTSEGTLISSVCGASLKDWVESDPRCNQFDSALKLSWIMLGLVVLLGLLYISEGVLPFEKLAPTVVAVLGPLSGVGIVAARYLLKLRTEQLRDTYLKMIKDEA